MHYYYKKEPGNTHKVLILIIYISFKKQLTFKSTKGCKMKNLIAMFFIAAIVFSCTEKQNQNPQKDSEEVAMLKETIAKFVPVEIKYDANLLNDREKVVLEKLYRASKIIDEIFLEQVYSKE